MTDAQIDAMQAGSEMDAAVLGAIQLSSLRHHNLRPSSNWSDAMFAAEEFGLFDRHVFGRDNVYCVWEINGPNEAVFAVATGATGPLAICRAILKLARR